MKMLTTIVFSLLISSAALARTNNETITCPSIEAIHQTAALMKDADTWSGGFGRYMAMIRDVEIDGSSWAIVAHDMIAKNDKEAAMIAAKRTAAVSQMVYPNARPEAPRADEYSCLYYDNSNPYVTIIAIQ